LPSTLTEARIIKLKIIKHYSGKIKDFSIHHHSIREWGTSVRLWVSIKHNFIISKTYIAKYSSASIKKEYRKFFYTLDCFELPIQVMK